MKKLKLKNFLKQVCFGHLGRRMPERTAVVQGLRFSACVLLILSIFSAVSCKVTTEGVEVLSGDFAAPALKSFSVESASEIDMVFSKNIKKCNFHVTKLSDNSVYSDGEVNFADSKKDVGFLLNTPTRSSEKYRLSGTVSDSFGNTLKFAVQFTGFNDRVPRMVISEVRSESSGGDKPKSEFVELYALSGGDIGGVTVYSASDKIDSTYEFPSCEVKAGEYIVLHFRTILATGETFPKDETGTNLTACKNFEATPGRDFWINNTTARIQKSNVILLRERDGGALMDALLFAEEKWTTAWKDDALKAAASEAYAAKLWADGELPSNAVNSEKATATRTVCRKNIALLKAAVREPLYGKQNGIQAWMLSASKNATPGEPNSMAEYKP